MEFRSLRVHMDIWGYEVREDGALFTMAGKPVYVAPSGNVKLKLNNGGIKNVSIQIIVAKCFLHPLEGHTQVRFKNGDKSNRHYTNLEWVKPGTKDKPTLKIQIERLHKAGYKPETIARRLDCSCAYATGVIQRFKKAVKEGRAN